MSEEAENFVINLLKTKGKLTTKEIEVSMKQNKIECPDELIRGLLRLRRGGKIKGEVVHEKGTWVWWVE